MEVELPGVQAADLPGSRQFRQAGTLLIPVQVEHQAVAVRQDHVHLPLRVALAEGERGVEADTELTARDLKELAGRFRTTENRLTVHSPLL